MKLLLSSGGDIRKSSKKIQKLLDTWSSEKPFSIHCTAANNESDAAKGFLFLEDNLQSLAASSICS